jgi:hypothetical protein
MSEEKKGSGEHRLPSATQPIDRAELERRLEEMRAELPAPEPAADFDADEITTLLPCFACGGDFKVREDNGGLGRFTTCPWCTRGAMSATQIGAWRNRPGAT